MIKKYLPYIVLISLLIFSFSTLQPSSSATTQLPAGTAANVENISENTVLELWPNGEYYIWDNVSADAYSENLLPENLPLKSADWNMVLSYPSSGEIKVRFDTSTTLSQSTADWFLNKNFSPYFPGDGAELLNTIDGRSGLVQTAIRDKIKGKRVSDLNLEKIFDTILGKLSPKYVNIIEDLAIKEKLLEIQEDIGSLVIKDASCTKSKWHENENNIEIDLSITLENIGSLSNSKFTSHLPFSGNIDYSFDGENVVITITGGGEKDQFELALESRRNRKNWHGSVELQSRGNLPRNGDKVTIQNYPLVPSLSLIPSTVQNAWLKVRQNWVDDAEIKARFRAPENADVDNLPSDHNRKSKNYYEWADDNAVDATASIMNKSIIPKVEFAITEVSTNIATDVENYSATLNSTVELGDYSNVNVKFWYRQSGNPLWKDTSWTPISSPTYSKSISELEPGTSYEFKAVIGRDWWIDHGNIKTFTTLSPPTPPPPVSPELPETAENITPENRAENLAGTDPKTAATVMNGFDPELAGDIINAAVDMGLSEEIGRIINLMETSKAVAARHTADLVNSAAITKRMVADNLYRASIIIEAGFKSNSSVEVGIMNEIDKTTAGSVLITIYDLPETPQVAADLLGSMDADKSSAAISYLIQQDKEDYIIGMFSLLSTESLNTIYQSLTIGERGEIWPELPSKIQERISEELAPRFELSDLEIGKTEVEPGETLQISVNVSNTGGTPDSYTANLIINDEQADQDTVTLDPGESEPVSFEISKTETGEYSIQIDGLSGSFEVVEEATPGAPPEEEKGWPWTAVIVVIIIVVAIAAAFAYRKR